MQIIPPGDGASPLGAGPRVELARVLDLLAAGVRRLLIGGRVVTTPDRAEFTPNRILWVRFDPRSGSWEPVERRAIAPDSPGPSRGESYEEQALPASEVPPEPSLLGWPLLPSEREVHSEGGEDFKTSSETEEEEILTILNLALANFRPPVGGRRWVQLPVLVPGGPSGCASFLWNEARRRVEAAVLRVFRPSGVMTWRFLPEKDGKWYFYKEDGNGAGQGRVDLLL